MIGIWNVFFIPLLENDLKADARNGPLRGNFASLAILKVKAWDENDAFSALLLAFSVISP